jgi:hypothetical protein
MAPTALLTGREIRRGFLRRSIANADAHAMQSTLRTCLVPIGPSDAQWSAVMAALEEISRARHHNGFS